MGVLGERFRKHTSNVSLWTQPPLMLVQPCLRGRECNLTVAVPPGGLSIPSLFAVGAQQALRPVAVAEAGLKRAQEHVGCASGGDESVGATLLWRSLSPASGDAMRFLVAAWVFISLSRRSWFPWTLGLEVLMLCCDLRADHNACPGAELPRFCCCFSVPGRIAALNMLAHGMEISTVPYLWTAMFGKSIRYAGKGLPKAAVEFVLVEVSWDRGATATSLAGTPPRQTLPRLCFPSWLRRVLVSPPKSICRARGMAVVTEDGPA